MLHSEDNNGGNPLRSIGVDDDVYTGELKEDIKDVARAVLKGDRDITKVNPNLRYDHFYAVWEILGNSYWLLYTPNRISLRGNAELS